MSIIPKIIQWIKGYFSNKKTEEIENVKGVVNEKMIKSAIDDSLITQIKELYKEIPSAKWDKDINILAIRDENNIRDDIWNDIIVLAVRNNDDWKIYSFIGTCDPSSYWTSNANRRKHGWEPNGVAHLSSGFQKDIWNVGKHRGYTAMAQTGGPVNIWRDYNENYNNDDEAMLRKLGISNNGYYGINLHHGGNSSKIGLYSAGCQVIQKVSSFNKFMELVMNNEKYINDKNAKYSYLIKETSEVSSDLIVELKGMAV
jgi:hypothetical protein